MNVYYARSLRGGRTDAGISKAIVTAIRSAGHQPQFDLKPIERDLNWTWDQYVYHRDIDWLNQCHCMVAEVSKASGGVGYEIAYARHKLQIPILLVYLKDTSISAMYSTLPGVGYRDTGDLPAYVESFLGGLHATTG